MTPHTERSETLQCAAACRWSWTNQCGSAAVWLRCSLQWLHLRCNDMHGGTRSVSLPYATDTHTAPLQRIHKFHVPDRPTKGVKYNYLNLLALFRRVHVLCSARIVNQNRHKCCKTGHEYVDEMISKTYTPYNEKHRTCVVFCKSPH